MQNDCILEWSRRSLPQLKDANIFALHHDTTTPMEKPFWPAILPPLSDLPHVPLLKSCRTNTDWKLMLLKLPIIFILSFQLTVIFIRNEPTQMLNLGMQIKKKAVPKHRLVSSDAGHQALLLSLNISNRGKCSLQVTHLAFLFW